ncbi:MAG: 6-carboxytetrahydropterin synthase [Myxococcales bacterium]|nr:MAG: 6-carboxytetrahydropterin synthase [Myxococcales bacterium]
MFCLGVSDHVMIAHSFADPFFGPAQRLHGATYGVEVTVRTPALGPHHVVMDIGALRSILRTVLAALDYSNLDDHPAFPGRTSTTERVAEHLARAVAAEVAALPPDAAPPAPASLRVVLRESPVAWASFELALPGGAA